MNTSQMKTKRTGFLLMMMRTIIGVLLGFLLLALTLCIIAILV